MASSGKYIWSPHPPVDRHTKVKHGIIHDYIDEYIHTLAKRRVAVKLKLSIFDCFCGGGLYTEGTAEHLGSPFQILTAVKDAEASVQNQDYRDSYNVDAQYLFSDNDEEGVITESGV